MDNLSGEVLANIKYGDGLHKIEIFSPYICKSALPGQFVNIKCSQYLNTDPLLRRPFSIYDIDKKFNVFSVFFIVKGRGTAHLSNIKKGEILDFIGPLGKGFVCDKSNNKYILIGGGIGIAPLYMIAKDLVEKDKSVSFIAGFKDETFFSWQRDIDKILRDYYIFTENGSFGQKGIPGDYIKTNIKIFAKSRIIICGPRQMLIQMQDIFKNEKIDAVVLMEETIACGIGACMGCVIKVKTDKNNYEYKRVCSDGPFFKLSEVCFD